MTSGRLGFLLLAIWLILAGIVPLMGINVPNSTTIMAILALVSGLLILISHVWTPRRWWS